MQAKLLVVAVVAAISLAGSAGAVTVIGNSGNHFGQVKSSHDDQGEHISMFHGDASPHGSLYHSNRGWKTSWTKKNGSGFDFEDRGDDNAYEGEFGWGPAKQMSGPVTGVVEPVSWAMLLIGFLGIGSVLRVTRQSPLKA